MFVSNKELKNNLSFIIGMAIYANKTQTGEIGDVFIKREQEKNIQLLSDFIKSIPEKKDIEYKLKWEIVENE